MIEFLASGLVGLRYGKHLLQAEVLRTGLDDLFCFFYIETADNIIYRIIGTAQGWIAVLQQGAVRRRMFSADALLFGIGFFLAIDDSQDGFFIRQTALRHILAQACPVFCSGIGAEQGGFEAVFTHQIILQGIGTSF